ncbi:MAG TPA: dipeptidase [Candidatus Polarisedimenticolaceae bacterium]|nr:dipeptidase [Candidatus Polarisedimenticolaceae bacterium]
MSATAAYVRENRDRYLEELKDVLRIPSVSTDPRRAGEVRRAAEWVRDRLARAGCTKTAIHETARHPIVYGEWLGAPGRPTILVYGHYDVQPEDPVELWATPAFSPTIRDGRLYARGACDDKGQFIIHVNAFEAHLKTGGRCPVNVKFLIEGEEEIGSPNLEPFIASHKSLLACDAVVVSDTAMFDKKTPSIVHGLRGLSYIQIDVRGTARDLHSGTFGGAVINPAFALAHIIAQLKDAKGKVRIPGFYDRVRKLNARERRAFQKLPHSDAAFRKSIGAKVLFGEPGYTTLERIWARPTLEVNGIWGGFTGEGAKTVIPAEAHAKVSMRLVPAQRPKEIVAKATAFIKKIAPKSVDVTVQHIHSGEGWLAETDHLALQAASRAVKKAFGKTPVFTREGGSIPVVATFDRVLRVPSVLMGIGLHDDNLHAPNEKIDLDNFFSGNEAAAYLMEELGAGFPSKGAGSRRFS